MASALGLFGCGGASKSLDRIEVSPGSTSIASGTTQSFDAIAIYTDGSRRNVTQTVDWSVNTVGIATTDGNTMRGTAVGSTSVLATHPGGLEGRASLTVTSAVVVSLAITPANVQLARGTSAALTATGTFSDGTTQDLTSQVDWSSSATTVSIQNGTARADEVGPATITATHAGTSVSANATVTVTAAVLTSIDVTPTNPSIPLGTNQQFAATGRFSDSTVQDLTPSVTWSCANSSVATASNAPSTRGRASGVGVGSTTVAALHTSTGISGSTTLTVTAAALVSIAVTPTNPSIALGLNRQFTATGTYTDASNADITTLVTWSSATPGVATISNAGGSEGLATSVATGSSLMTATHSGTGIHGSTTLTVTAAELVSIAVTPTNPSIALGLSQQFTATGTYTDASNANLTTAVTWSSATPGTATVSNAGGSEGLASSVATGSSLITAAHTGTGIHGSTTLTVTAAELVSIAVTPANPSIALGLSRQFTATGTYTDASNADITTSVTWSSGTPGTATISNAGGSEGLATSVASGGSLITATHPSTGIHGSTTLTVTAAVLVSIAVTPTNPSIALGLAQQFTATGTYTDASNANITNSVTWSSGTPGTATISNAGGSEGLATGVATGGSLITATHSGSGVNGSTTLTVTAAELASISVTPANRSITTSGTEPFTATGTYTDASNVDITTSVTWSSSAAGVATISNAGGSEGLATAVAVGSTTITATHSGSGVFGSTPLDVIADITYVGADSTFHASNLDLDVPTPSGIEAGDVLIAAIAIRPSTATITPPAGWTLIRRTDATGGASNSLATYRRIASASEPGTYRWTFSESTGSAGAIACFRGADETSPIDVENGTDTASALTHTTPDVTTTVARTMLVTAYGYSSSATWTPPGGMSEIVDTASLPPNQATGISLSVNYELVTGVGATGTRTATAATDSDTGNAHAIALSPE